MNLVHARSRNEQGRPRLAPDGHLPFHGSPGRRATSSRDTALKAWSKLPNRRARQEPSASVYRGRRCFEGTHRVDRREVIPPVGDEVRDELREGMAKVELDTYET